MARRAKPGAGLRLVAGRDALCAALLVAATVAAYAPALGAGFIWDDEQYVTANAALRDPGGLTRIWTDPWSVPQYYPLTMTSFWIERRLWGDHPAGYHLTNVLLHALSSVLLWRLLRRLGARGALLAGFVFALHPVHVESVAWITERKNVLSGLFFFLSLAAYFRFDAPEGGTSRRPAAGGAAFLLFVAALLAKTVTSALPAVALLVVYWKRGRITWRDAAPLLPFFAVGAVAGSWTAWLERHRVGALGPDWDLSFLERLVVAGRAVWFYLGKLVWPHPLLFVYPRWDPDPAAWLAWVPPVAAALLVALLWFQRPRWGRAPLVAALYFGGMLMPALSFVNVFPMMYSFVADHFQYLASIGPIALAAAGLASFTRRRAATVAWPIALAALSFSQARVYTDLETLWRATLLGNPAAWMARSNLASLLHSRANEIPDPEARLRLLREAESEYYLALAARPENLPARVNLARLLEALHDDAAAEREYRAAAELPARYPAGSRGDLQRGDGWFHLGRFLEARGRDAEAMDAYRRAVEIHAGFDLARAALGALLIESGRIEDARVQLQAAIATNPRSTPALNNLGSLLAGEGRLDEALTLWRRALAVDPGSAEAHANVGRGLMLQGRLEDAAMHLHRALELRPGFAAASDDLARCQGLLRAAP